MKTKLLLTISIICLLLASTQAAIPYEYFPDRSEADGETPGAQIPNCINQRGPTCLACGPDTSKTPAVPLFPNGVNQCIPNPTGSGCNRFLDVQGNVCDVRQGCNCKFVLNSVATTCVTSTIPNCFILAADGTCNQCIGLNRRASYMDQFGLPQILDPAPIPSYDNRLAQKTPVGGGISDYGRSFDGKTCVDNLANGNPNCLEYLNATSCNKCDSNFVLVQTGTQTASLRKCVRIPGFIDNATSQKCLAFALDGKKCFTCRTNFVLNVSGTCDPLTDSNFLPGATNKDANNCLRYAKGPDGKDDTTRCLQCVQFSFHLQDRSCSVLLTTEHQSINYVTGASSENPGSDCRLFYQATFDDQTKSAPLLINRQTIFTYCLVKQAANDYYIPQPTTPAAVSTDNTRSELFCKNFDSASGKCLTCMTGYYLNTINGSCNSNSAGTCSLAGCQTANGYAYCTECERGYYPVPVDGMCVKYSLVDLDTQKYCKTVTNGECTECDPEYFLDLQDTLSNPSTKRNKCRLLEINSNCSVWKAGRCVECSEQAQNLVNGKCVWAPDTTFGGVPGCATHQSDGKCQTAYPYAFLSKDKTFTRIISNECASYDEDGNCTSVNNINYVLNFNYPTGLFVATIRNLAGGDAGFCDKTYDNSCTCVTCKPTFTLSATQTCPINKDGSSNDILPDTVIRGCIQFATASTCEKCRSPDFLLTADGKCYDLKFMKYQSLTGWKNLFLQITETGQSGNAAQPSATTVYNPNYYEACTEASTISACKTCFSGRTTNILLTIASADAAYFGSDITYCHDNTNTDFKSLTAQKSVLINDGNTLSRDTEALQLDRVAGCLTYTSLVLGTCATCGANLTKSADNTICYKSDGADGDGNNGKDCGTVDTSGSCLTCINTQDYIYVSTFKVCVSKYISDYKDCMSIDTTTFLCLTCNPSHVFHVDDKECKSVLDFTSQPGCNTSQCAIGTATYVPQVTGPPVINGYLQVASCGKGYNYDTTNKNCLRNKSDWTTSVAEIDAQTGYFLTCNTGYTLFKTATYTICIPTIANCKTYNFDGNLVSCDVCGKDANGNPTLPANENLGGFSSLCIPAQNYLPNCEIYNLSGSGCLKCNSNTQNLEAQGCKLPPNCSTIDPNTLRCSVCTNGKLSPQGDCVLTIPGKWAASADCSQAFNATHCAECAGSQIIAIDDSNNDNQYGVGECIEPSTIGCPITGCELILRNQNQLNCKLTTHECIRCQIGYSMLGGQCYSNTDSEQRFPHECVNVEYDEDRRAYVCTECDFGFAITTDRRKCIPNYGPCSYLDSTDCASYDLAQGHEEVQIECAKERESSSSLIISATLMIILNIIFFSI